jgi:hypothetical protein
MGRRTAITRKFSQHRIWMPFSYAMTFGAVTLRPQIPLGFILFGYHSYAAMTPWLAYTSWLPNVLIVGAYTIKNRLAAIDVDVTAGQRRLRTRAER